MNDEIKLLLASIPAIIASILLCYEATKYHLWVWYPKEWAGKTKKELG
jgi:hypothetical protein